MRIFLDSSKVEEAKKWMSVLDGATTNPSILLKDGGNIYEFAKLFGDKPVSVEATGDFRTEALEYAKNIPNAVIKIPLLNCEKGNNLDLIKELSKKKIPINRTALFSLSQVLLATKAGARYVSLFAGRVDDEGGDSSSMIRDCVKLLADEYRHGSMTELIVGSIRTPKDVLSAVNAGAHIVTIPPPILDKMINHEFSRTTVRQFEADAKKLKGG